jgi:hypothetical protein
MQSMSRENGTPRWLVFVAQLPGSPSSPRVALWRRLRAVGAAGMLNGAWVLPHTQDHLHFFEQSLEMVHRHGGSGFVLPVSEPPLEVNKAIVGRFHADRGCEYDEFAERCDAFLAEIDKESRAGKFIFAELEESEQDLEKLARWLAKIRKRDFFPDDRLPSAVERMDRCRNALEGFSASVYEAENVQETAGDAVARRFGGDLREDRNDTRD